MMDRQTMRNLVPLCYRANRQEPVTVNRMNKVNKMVALGFSRHVACSWVRAQGRCEYCHRDLITDRLGYVLQETDHLLPQSRFPEYVDDQRNTVLSCSARNGIKGDHVVLECGEKPAIMLEDHRHVLVQRVRQHIADLAERAGYDGEWRRIRRILLEC